MSDNTTSGVSANSRASPEIEIVGTLQPNPLPRSLPEGSTITVRLDMTLQNSDSPLTFATKSSFIDGNQTFTSRFRIYHPATDNGEAGWRRMHVLAVAGPLVDVDKDLLTLYPDVTVSVDVATKVYTKKADDGQLQQYFFGSRLSTMEDGDKYEMCLGAAYQPIMWLYWGTKEDIIEEYSKINGHSRPTGECSRTLQLRGACGWGDQPLLRLVKPIEFSVVE